MINLFIHEVKSRVKGIIGWGIGLIAFAGLYITVYPQVEEQMTALADLSIYQIMGIEMGSFEGYMSSVVLGFLPLLLGVYAIIIGTKTLAGEEDAGTLELMMAKPLSRWQIVTVKALAVAVVLALILLIAATGDALILLGVRSQISTTVNPWALFGVVLSAWPISMALAMIGLFLGAFMPNRRLAATVTGALLAVSYFGENITGMVDQLKPLKPLSLFSYYDSTSQVFSQGVQGGDLLVLLLTAIVAFVLGLVCFQYRNVTVGTWIWRRGRLPKQQYNQKK